MRENHDLLHAFDEAGLLADFFTLAEGIFADGLEARLPHATPHRAMKAPALLALLRSWNGTPEHLGTFFHSLV